MNIKNTKSAICFIPPIEGLEYIQDVRKTHDKAYDRWMPHINLIFPFIDSDKIDKVTAELETVLSKVDSFPISFSKFEAFTRKKDVTAHLVPEMENEECTEIYNLICKVLGINVDEQRPYHPHLTVGQFKKSDWAGWQSKLTNEFESFTYLCDKVYVIERGDDTPFEIVKTISLARAFM